MFFHSNRSWGLCSIFFLLENYILSLTIPILIQQALEVGKGKTHVCTGPSEKTINISNAFKRIGTKVFLKFFFIYLFYFWLHWVFVVERAFSS